MPILSIDAPSIVSLSLVPSAKADVRKLTLTLSKEELSTSASELPVAKVMAFAFSPSVYVKE